MQIPGAWYLVVSVSVSWVWSRNWWFLASVQVLLMLLIQGSHYENQGSGTCFLFFFLNVDVWWTVGSV